ncbi:hypothetical protein C6Q08_11565 [Burkholderia multivorans]|uniref:hypothetical protein n=1 Tax=Burkholderia multivorans TaxID=87883 RepID=UPI000D471743|nr:hypothetical protein [Burkholderia multivorans]PRF33822.1 hypothetical protein C6Q08_11565 [Burkholderia multivorans]
MERTNEPVLFADVSLNGLTLDIAYQNKLFALPTVQRLVQKMALRLPDGVPVRVDIELDEFAVNKPIFRGARATFVAPGRYKVEIGVGLITQLSVVSRCIAFDKSHLRGRTKAKLLRQDVRRSGRANVLADCAFHYMLTFVLWHEIAHIALGHLDWLKARTGMGIIDEFGTQPMPDTKYTHSQTLEADADRQASIWTAAVIEAVTQNNHLLYYPALPDLFYDIGYIYGALFGFLDSVDSRQPDTERYHPTADIRLGIVLAFVNDYLLRTHKDAAPKLRQEVIAGGMSALQCMLYQEKRPYDIFRTPEFMAGNGRRLAELGVRRLQHRVETSDISSFVVLGT